jgi:hypothetical protein
MARWDRERWINWSRDVVVEHPKRRYHPTCRADLVTIVRDAEKDQPPRQLHACGSHWSFTDIAVSRDWFVETRDLRATLYDVLPAALTDQARRDLLEQDGSGPTRSYYHVEAGITVHDLNLRLDRRPLCANDRKWARMPLDGLADEWPGASMRWALPTMGGAAGQTLAGAITTGTHGGDHGLPPMADMVVAINLIGPGGKQWWIERDNPITDRARLLAALPEVEYRTSTELFDAILVSAGRMGIVYSFVLRVVEQFWLEQVTTASHWEQESASLRTPFAAFDRRRPGQDVATTTRFLETVVLPYAGRGGTHVCYQTSRWTAPVRHSRPRPKGPDFFALLCRHSTITPVVFALIGVTVLAIPLSLFIPLVGSVLVSVEVLILLGLIGLLIFVRMSLGDLIARACNLANRIGRSWLVRHALAAVIGRARPRVTTCDVGYELMDLAETGGECYRSDSMEAFFDAHSGAHVDFVEQDLFAAFEESAKAGRTVAGYVSLRFTRRSSALLAMQRWDVTCSVEVALLKGIEGNAEVLNTLEVAALRRGGTIHWGQRNSTDAAAVAASYPGLERWRKRLTEIIADGPTGTFDNDFCATRGLEPQP